MISIFLVSTVALVLSFLLTPLCRRLAAGIGMLDRPDGGRKLHSAEIPRAGGVAVMVAYAVAFAVLLAMPLPGSGLLRHRLSLMVPVLQSVGIVFIVGVLDDMVQLRPWQKFAGQLAAALLAWGGGIRIEQWAGVPLAPWLAGPLTVLWLMACTNALNLIDGLDGLAAGVGLFASVTMLLAGLVNNNVELALATAPLAAALLGFLWYNFNPASIFLGDSGSLTVGFLLGCMGVLWSQKSATLLGITAPVMLLAVPMLDTVLAILRRFLRRQPIFQADRGHIHHRLLDRGLTPRRAVLLLYGACAVAASLSLIQANLHDGRLSGLVLILFCAAAGIGIQRLRFPEFVVARRMLAAGAFRDQLNVRISLSRLAAALAEAGECPERCWPVVREACAQFGFHDIRLQMWGVLYRDPWPASPGHWSLYVPLSAAGDYLQLSREFENPAPCLVTPLVDLLRRHLGSEWQEISRPAACGGR